MGLDCANICTKCMSLNDYYCCINALHSYHNNNEIVDSVIYRVLWFEAKKN